MNLTIISNSGSVDGAVLVPAGNRISGCGFPTKIPPRNLLTGFYVQVVPLYPPNPKIGPNALSHSLIHF